MGDDIRISTYWHGWAALNYECSTKALATPATLDLDLTPNV